LLHAGVDPVAAMLELHREQAAPDGDCGAVSAGLLLLVGEGESGAFGAGVDAQLHAVDDRFGSVRSLRRMVKGTWRAAAARFLSSSSRARAG
jgi:hypothetical protein